MKKKNKKAGASKKPKDEAKDDDAGKEETSEAGAAATTEDAPADDVAESGDVDDKAVDDEKPSDTSPTATPSLAQQSKLRSTSFRAGTAGGPASPGPFSPEGDTAPDIYRKNVARIEELEKENKRLAKESTDAEKRWKKAEDELADLREAEGDAAGKGDDTSEKLVRPLYHETFCPQPLTGILRKARLRHCNARTRSYSNRFLAEAMRTAPLSQWPHPQPTYEPNLTPRRRLSNQWKLRFRN